MSALRLLNNLLERLFMAVSVVLLTILIAVVFIQVVSRNYLHLPVLWSNEVALLSFAWTVFLGSAVAVRHRKHYIVEVFPPEYVRINLALDIIAGLAILPLIYVFAFDGYTFTLMGLKRLSTSIAIPQAVFFAPIPISAVAMFFFNLEVLASDIKKAFALLKGVKTDGSVNSVNG